MSPIRILLADDHAVLRAGLKSMLNDEEDMIVVGEAGDGIRCIDLARETTPDVVVMDINMPNCNGLEALAELRNRGFAGKILFLTMHDDPAYLRRVIEGGGAGYLLKQSAGEELLAAIRAVHEGGIYVSPQHAKIILQASVESDAGSRPSDGAAERHSSLSDREAEIFKLIALGHSNREIAEMLFISVKTVETYKARMMRKLDLGSRAALVRLALELGILG